MFYGYISGDTREADERQRLLLVQCGVDEICIYCRNGVEAVPFSAVLAMLHKGDTLLLESLGCLDSAFELETLSACVRKKEASVLLIQEELELNGSNSTMIDALIQGLRNIAKRQDIRAYSHKHIGRPKTDAEKLRLALKLYDSGEVTKTSICRQFGISRSALYRAIYEHKEAQIAQALDI